VTEKKKMGAPHKAPGGMTHVAYVRLDRELWRAVKKHQRRLQRQRHAAGDPRKVSQSDVIRDILRESLI